MRLAVASMGLRKSLHVAAAATPMLVATAMSATTIAVVAAPRRAVPSLAVIQGKSNGRDAYLRPALMAWQKNTREGR